MIPMAYIGSKYGYIAESTFGKLVFAGMVGLIIGVRFMMYRLKTIADEGYGMEKEVSREVRFLIPTILLLLIVQALNRNIGDLVDILTFTLIFNVIAVPFRIASYRLSKRYENDIAPKKTYDYMKTKL